MANRLSSHMRGAATSVDDQVSDDPSLSLPLYVPMAVQTYYEKICKIPPLARRNIIINRLQVRRGLDSQERYNYVVAEVKHLRGHDISDRLECLLIKKSLNSPNGSLSSSSRSAKHVVSQCRRAGGGNEVVSNYLEFDTSSDSDVRKLCSLEELFRLITIISNNSHLYSTDIDASVWFAATIMETAKAIFPLSPDNDDYGWFARTFFKSLLYRPESECGRQIVAAYKADKKKDPTPTPQSISRQSSAAPENENMDGSAGGSG